MSLNIANQSQKKGRRREGEIKQKKGQPKRQVKTLKGNSDNKKCNLYVGKKMQGARSECGSSAKNDVHRKMGRICCGSVDRRKERQREEPKRIKIVRNRKARGKVEREAGGSDQKLVKEIAV